MAMITNTPYMIQVRQTPVEELNIDGPALDLKIDSFLFLLKTLALFLFPGRQLFFVALE